MKTLWELFIQEYSQTTNIPVQIIEYVATYPIILNCAMGLSNIRISRRLMLPTRYIKETLEEYLSMRGWEIDLDISPIALYNRSNGVYEAYCMDIDMSSSIRFNNELKKQSFDICKRTKEIKELIKEYGY